MTDFEWLTTRGFTKIEDRWVKFTEEGTSIELAHHFYGIILPSSGDWIARFRNEYGVGNTPQEALLFVIAILEKSISDIKKLTEKKPQKE